MARPKASVVSLGPVDLGGVVLGNAALTVNAQRFERITSLLGRRLLWWLQQPGNADCLPPQEWTENFKHYSSALVNQLKEQRERYRLVLGEQSTPEQLQAQFREELQRALQTFTPEERAFAMKLWETNAIAAPKTTETEQ
jgi:hypothetical protein